MDFPKPPKDQQTFEFRKWLELVARKVCNVYYSFLVGEEISVTIDAATEEAVANPFSSEGIIPSRWMIVDLGSDHGIIRKGDTEWTSEWLYFKNVSSTSSASVVIFLFRP